MRILLSCLQGGTTAPIPAFSFWRGYFVNGLEEAGHAVLEVPDVNWAAGLGLQDEALRKWRGETWQRTVNFVQRQGGIDLFLGYLYPAQIEPTAIAEIRAAGIPCVNFFCDNVREFRKVPAAFAGFDLHWVPEKKAGPLYARAGLPHLHAPMPAWVAPRWRTPPLQEDSGPLFIGSRDPQRAHLLAETARRGAPFIVYGANWTKPGNSPGRVKPALGRRVAGQWNFFREQGATAWLRRHFEKIPPAAPFPADRIGPELGPEQYQQVTRGCAVAIGINRYPSFRHPFNAPGTYSRLRDIEAPMLGACYLTEWTEGLDELYELGAEIETYRTAEELAAKIAELMRDRARRQRLRVAGQQRALSEHTIGRSVARIAGQLGIAPPRPGK